MKRLLLLGVLAVTLFGASFGVSWYTLRMRSGKPEEGQEQETEAEAPQSGSAGGTPDWPLPPPVVPLPSPVPSPGPSREARPDPAPAAAPPRAEVLAQLVANLQERLNAFQARERELDERERNLLTTSQDIHKVAAELEERRRLFNRKLAELERARKGGKRSPPRHKEEKS